MCPSGTVQVTSSTTASPGATRELLNAADAIPTVVPVSVQTPSMHSSVTLHEAKHCPHERSDVEKSSHPMLVSIDRLHTMVPAGQPTEQEKRQPCSSQNL